VAPVLLVVLALPLAGAEKSSRPPRELHRVGDHWTAYNAPDPSTYPAGAKTYAIKRGDTLWGLAQRQLGNAYLWPQLWESNTWITDAHWIYPGDVLLIEGEAARAAAATTGTASAETVTTTAQSTTATASTAAQEQRGFETVAAAPVTREVTKADAIGGTSSPVALGAENDLYCYGYIGDPNEPMPNRVMAYEDYESFYDKGAVRQDLGGSDGDLVFIQGGTATGLNPGETYLVVEGEELVHNPISKVLVGRQYEFRGQIRILCADDHHARGIITQSCMDIHVGARLKPMPTLPIPLAQIPNMPGFCDPNSGKRAGTIVHAEGGWESALGTGLLVQVDLGRDDALQPGDFLTVYREDIQPGQPRQVLGEIGVLTTEAKTATGKIVAMRYAMHIGDRVEIR
jgi:nucleoid-associated protein YgaU